MAKYVYLILPKSAQGGLEDLLKDSEADLDLFSVMQRKDILTLARARGMIDVGDERIAVVYRVRNSISHAKSPPMNNNAEVGSVAWVKDYCLGMLEAGASR